MHLFGRASPPPSPGCLSIIHLPYLCHCVYAGTRVSAYVCTRVCPIMYPSGHRGTGHALHPSIYQLKKMETASRECPTRVKADLRQPVEDVPDQEVASALSGKQVWHAHEGREAKHRRTDELHKVGHEAQVMQLPRPPASQTQRWEAMVYLVIRSCGFHAHLQMPTRDWKPWSICITNSEMGGHGPSAPTTNAEALAPCPSDV
jgi:hypothetical protein